MEECKLLVIGGGAAGMAAALAADRAGTAPVMLLERSERLGGVLPQCAHRGFGLGYFRKELTGPEYAEPFIQALSSSRVMVCLNSFVKELRADKSAVVWDGERERQIAFSRCILASGCRERTIWSLAPAGTRPAGVFTAGAAQRLVNLGHYDIGRRIVILGSGDVGLVMTHQLRDRVAAIVEIQGEMGGSERNRRGCAGIPVILNATVEALEGNGRLEAVVIRHCDGSRYERIPCDTLITALGLIPERELLGGFDSVPDWLSLCGNCDHVHAVVDSVTIQGEKLGARPI